MINLHNHTTWSDGAFSLGTIVKAAIDAGLAHVGICDHFATSKLGPRWTVSREHLPQYAAAIRQVAAAYAGQIRVWVGLEIDSAPMRTDLDALGLFHDRAEPLDCLDYVLFEYVGEAYRGGLPLQQLVALRPRIGVPVGLAHSFLAATFEDRYTPRELANTLAAADLFVELSPTPRNAVLSAEDVLGLERRLGSPQLTPTERRRLQEVRDQPWLRELGHVPAYRYSSPYNDALWPALVGAGVRFSIGTDTHDELNRVGEVADAWTFLQALGGTCFPMEVHAGDAPPPQ
jgi:hypothetical protein